MRQIEEMNLILSHSPLNVVEVGAGKGLLCADILLSAKEKSPTLFNDLKYFIVEKARTLLKDKKAYRRIRPDGQGLMGA